jgi:hypothetical protein
MKNKRLLVFIGAGALAGCLCIAGVMGGKAITALAAHVPPATSAPPTPHPEAIQVTYSESQTGDRMFANVLWATFNGKRSRLIDPSKEKCLKIIDQRDIDGNGLTDALVMDIVACGGNCCPNEFFFVSALPDGSFQVSNNFADSWGNPVIEKWKDRWSVVVVSNNEGVNCDRPVEITRRFVLEKGKAVKVAESRLKDIASILEMRSEIFKCKDSDETHTIKYDLDGDGKKDAISGTLWGRWGRIEWKVDFADGKKFSSSNHACKRIGVLAAKTNGVHNLVCDQDTVFRWDGNKYIE